ncbi:hypothetical protein OIU84_021579 [Salix udensis]|uniref:Uncharacterized protein n=1 Tax=Salix udensis TaxID=889485 RepID=A0AAD6PHQ4_9ROSI|nr:hypothetical protein OIU84_021579 [Salix udensis]
MVGRQQIFWHLNSFPSQNMCRSHTGFQVPHFEMKYAIAAAISVKAAGSLLFIFGSSIWSLSSASAPAHRHPNSV